MKAQGQKFEAQDWWPDEKRDDKEKRTKVKASMEEIASTLTILGVKGPKDVTEKKEEEDVEEDKEGDIVFVSPEGSVIGAEEDGDRSGGSIGGLSLVLPIRGSMSAGS